MISDGSVFLGLTMNAWILIIVMFSLSGAALFIYLGAKRSGQFDNVEAIKYRMLLDEEDWEFDE